MVGKGNIKVSKMLALPSRSHSSGGGRQGDAHDTAWSVLNYRHLGSQRALKWMRVWKGFPREMDPGY